MSSCPPTDAMNLLENLKSDTVWLRKVTSEIIEYVMYNEEIRQILCDALPLEVKDEVNKLKTDQKFLKNESLENAIKEQEQSRHNYLTIHGLPTKKNKNTDTEAINIFAKHLNINISDNKLDCFHQLDGDDGPII